MIVADSAEVDSLNAAVKVFVGVVPPDLTGIVEVRDDVASVVDWNRTAPVLRHVQMADVQMGEQPAYLQGFGVKDIEDRGYEVLADGNAGPLLLQKREGLQVSWWFLFHTDKSTLPFRVGFPIIMANAVDASLRQASLSEIAAAPTGVLPVPKTLLANGQIAIVGRCIPFVFIQYHIILSLSEKTEKYETCIFTLIPAGLCTRFRAAFCRSRRVFGRIQLSGRFCQKSSFFQRNQCCLRTSVSAFH